MGSRARVIVAVAVVAVAALVSGSARAGAATQAALPGRSGWGAAIEVPGMAALNRGGYAAVNSVSCGSAGNCGAGGYYGFQPGSPSTNAFVVSEVNGTWHKAIEVPGTAILNQGVEAQILSVSCGSAGNCSAGGSYFNSSTGQQAFVVSQVNGTWHKAIEVPGTAVLNQGGQGEIASVSCASAGNCSASGSYRHGSALQVFVVSQVNGTWHKAIEAPGTAALNKGGDDFLATVSCGATGNCSAGGFYTDGSGGFQAMLITQVNGTWHRAIEVPGTAALNHGTAELNSVSCTSAGTCSGGGTYAEVHNEQAFVASQVGGTWHKAIEVPGTAALNQGGQAKILSVSCTSAGHCSAGGTYTESSNVIEAFVVSQT